MHQCQKPWAHCSRSHGLYRELRADYFDRKEPVAAANRLVRRLRQLGYDESMTAATESTPVAETLVGDT